MIGYWAFLVSVGMILGAILGPEIVGYYALGIAATLAASRID